MDDMEQINGEYDDGGFYYELFLSLERSLEQLCGLLFMRIDQGLLDPIQNTLFPPLNYFLFAPIDYILFHDLIVHDAFSIASIGAVREA